MAQHAEWRLRTEMDDEGEILYWSNEDGWVDKDSATLFTDDERKTLTLPQGAHAWTTV